MLREGIAPLVARIAISGIFIPAAISKAFAWDGNVSYMASRGLPMIPVLLAASLVIEAAGTLCLLLGYRTRLAAAVMAAYLVPVTFACHDLLGTQFLKNAGIIGGLVMIAAYGPGRLSLDARRTRMSISRST